MPNLLFPARRERSKRPAFWLAVGLFSLPLISLAGCAAGGSPSMAGFTNFFAGATPDATPSPTADVPPVPNPTPTAVPTPVAEETATHPRKKTARQARAASENAAAASKNAANASAAAAQASKSAATASKQAAVASQQAASVASQVEGAGPTNSDVSLETNPAGTPASGTPAPIVKESATPASTPPLSASAGSAATSMGTPTLSPPAMESAGSSVEENPEKAAKLIRDVDKIEKRVDRKNLSADDSQRDILAQRLLQEAKKSLAEHDGVAAMSLATKASTLLAPLPKLADSAVPPAP